MTLWFIDASVLLASEDADDPHHLDAIRLLAGAEPIATLDLAYYEVSNVALRVWHDTAADRRSRRRVTAIAEDGGLVRADPALLSSAARVAAEHGISVYDAAYVAGADRAGGVLVSCDVRDLVSKGLARLPGDAVRTA